MTHSNPFDTFVSASFDQQMLLLTVQNLSLNVLGWSKIIYSLNAVFLADWVAHSGTNHLARPVTRDVASARIPTPRDQMIEAW